MTAPSSVALRERLVAKGPEALAQFILTLAHDDNGIGDYVQAFVDSDYPIHCEQSLREMLATVTDREREYDRRHALDDVFVRRLDHILDLLELSLAPKHPEAAFALLIEIIESDGIIADQVHEADLGPTFERACTLFLGLLDHVDPPKAAAGIKRLRKSDDHGLRQKLHMFVG